MEFTGIAVLLNHVYELYENWIELPAFLRWMGTGFIILFIEHRHPRLFLIWFAMGAFTNIIVASIFPYDLFVQMIGFVGATYLFYYYRRPIIAHLSPIDRLGLFSSAILGRSAVCAEAIKGLNAGMVRVAGSEWPAVSVEGPISKGSSAVIVGRRDLQLFVKPQTERALNDSGRLRKVIGRLGTLEIADGGILVIRIGRRLFPVQGFPSGVRLAAGVPVRVVSALGDNLLVELTRDAFVNPGDLNGLTGMAMEQIGGKKRVGSVKIDGIGWRAFSEADAVIKRGRPVQVVDTDGVTLIVKELDPCFQDRKPPTADRR